MTLRERLADIARFMARPTFASQPMPWGRAAVLALLAVFALDMAVDQLAYVLIDGWDSEAGFLPEPLDFDGSLTQDLLEFLVIAPLLEELAFRAWLTGRTAALRFAIYGFTALGLMLAGVYAPAEYAMPMALAGAACVFAGLIHWGRTRHRDRSVPVWFTRRFHWFVWGSSLLFGLIHLGNYEPLSHPLGLLVVLPQTIGGLLLAYTRTRIGLGAAMAHHAAYNAVFLLSDYGWW